MKGKTKKNPSINFGYKLMEPFEENWQNFNFFLLEI
jgi:hypothetical protein